MTRHADPQRRELVTADYDVDTERDYDFVSKQEFVRIRYRKRPTRRWSKVNVFTSESFPTIGSIMNNATLILEAFLNAGGHRGV